MNFRAQIENLLTRSLKDNPKLFLIDLSISGDNKVKIVLDRDDSVSLKDCINVSRAIEHNLDREIFDFGLEVASVGADDILTITRQYYKNIGRKLSVMDVTGKNHEGVLTSVKKNEILIEWKERQPKKIGKGKETVLKNKILSFSEITQSKVILKF